MRTFMSINRFRNARVFSVSIASLFQDTFVLALNAAHLFPITNRNLIFSFSPISQPMFLGIIRTEQAGTVVVVVGSTLVVVVVGSTLVVVVVGSTLVVVVVGSMLVVVVVGSTLVVVVVGSMLVVVVVGSTLVVVVVGSTLVVVVVGSTLVVVVVGSTLVVVVVGSTLVVVLDVGLAVKVAHTSLSASNGGTEQVSVPEHPAPFQPVNVEPLSGVAVSVTTVPEQNGYEQVLPQSMPAISLFTVPLPVPSLWTVSNSPS